MDMVGRGGVVTVCTTTVVLLADNGTALGVLLAKLAADVTVETPVDCVVEEMEVGLDGVVLAVVVCVVEPGVVEREDVDPVPVDVDEDGKLVEVVEDPLGVVLVAVLVVLPVPVFGTRNQLSVDYLMHGWAKKAHYPSTTCSKSGSLWHCLRPCRHWSHTAPSPA